MLLAVLVTLLSAGFTNVGKALQKKGTRTLPRLVYDSKVVREYLKHRTWLLGLLLDVGGGLLSVVALSQAPVSVVQPVASSGLALLAVFSHFYLDERLQRREWTAVAAAALGTVGVAACAPEAPAAAAVSARGALLLALGLLAAQAAVREVLQRGPSRGRWEELAAGAQAGVCFSLSAACCRAGLVVAAQPGRRLAAPLGLVAAASFTTAGVVAQTRALKEGAVMVVCTAGAVATMLTGALAGIVVLGESLPPTRAGRLTWLLSWAVIAGGVATLSTAGRGHSATVKGLTPMKEARLSIGGLSSMARYGAYSLRPVAGKDAESLV